jgi:hypothetical protein
MARQAILDLIRSRPDVFIGDPDADVLAKLPLKERGPHEFDVGAFVVDTESCRYHAEIGHDAPELYEYRGIFEERDGRWVATVPEVNRFHQAPR